ncbi:LysR family transcriptional regulator [Corynebacterium sp. SCR221107]|uniref:LysR family transcriptional regulator n=1 Tax=Corynebacterium sp. SCR221107 TaxID=3017361 RepID=UPI0022EC1D8A|nr:LysR family transcriptional regulator [Corynebacterium sp. SCR221107]WBT09268.1 LysR family transcriptional regulator [Corynebacterium sp. SCR221107]
MPLNLSRLRMLSELRRLGTINAVAEVLHFTHSSVSQQLAQLERETGHVLLEKAGRGVILTDAGKTLADYAERLLALSEEAESSLARHAPVSGTIRVASFQTVLVALIPEVISLLAQRHPGLRVEFVQHEVLEGMQALLNHEVDVCIGEQFPGTTPIGDKGIARHDFYKEPLLLVQPATGPLSVTTGLEELSAAPWVIDPRESAAGQFAWGVCQAAGFEPNVFIESPDPMLALQIVGKGQAIAILPSLIVKKTTDPDWAFRVPTLSRTLPGDPGRILFTAVRSGREHHPGIKAFCEVLAEVTKQTQIEAFAWEDSRYV